MAALVMLVVTGTLLSGTPMASAQANSPVTGQPTISMWPVPVTPRVTQTLRAYTTAIEDEDGMDDVSFTYQWVSNDGSTDTDIEGETGRTYVLRPSDEGKTFKVRVAFTDNGGNEESVTSEPTVEVVAEDAGICGRTPAVRKRLLRMVDVDFDSFVDCAIVTDAHLTSVTFMLLHGIPGSIPPPDFDSLRPGDLDGLTNLETLEVTGPISELPDGLFDDLTALRRLTLSRTNLTGLPEGVFDNLTRLTSLDLTGNRSLNALPDGAFDNLSNLTELDLRSSGFTQLPDDVFDSLTKLRHLELSGNPLTALPDDVFDSLTKLRHLELYGNPLTALPEGAFDNLTNLRVLKVNANLTTLPEGLLDNLTNLETLSLGGDELTALPDGLFDNLTNLEWLGLGGNELASLPGGIFDSLTNLESLVLNGNELASLPADLFQHTTSLRRLLLGGNPGAPFVFGLEVARNDDGSVVVNVSDATPFDIHLTLEAEGGALSATEVTLPAGSNSSEKIDVSPAGDGATAVRVVSAEFDATYISGIAVRRGTPLTLANANSDNHLATGAPTTTGTAQVGQTLAASTSAIADQDGLTNVTFEYQWASSDGTTDRDIEGATGSTYTLVASVVGTQVKVLVTFADDAGNHEMLTSEATANVESAPNVPATGQPVVIGKTYVKTFEILQADLSNIADENGMTGAEFAYTWTYTSDRGEFVDSYDSTNRIFTSNRGDTIKVYVTFMDDGGNWERVASDAFGPITYAPRPAEGAPVIHGIPRVGERLTAGTHGIFDGNGTENMSDVQWQWLVDDTEVEGEAGRSYMVKSTDVGKTIKVRLSFRDNDGFPESLVSAPTAPVVAADSLNSPATGAPLIRGTVKVGNTLRAITDYSSYIRDANGLTDPTFTYQWIRSDGTTDTNISDATSDTYTLVAADEGKTLKVRVFFTDDAGNDETLISAPSTAVAPATTPSANNPAQGAPVIVGTVQVGETLTVDTSGISDADGMENATFSFTWHAGYIEGQGGQLLFMGFGGYTVQPGDADKTLRVQWFFVDDRASHEHGSVTTATVAATIPDAPENLSASPSATGALGIQWDAPWWDPLSLWESGAVGDGGSPITTYTVQWKKAAGNWDTDEDVSEATATSTTHTISGLELDVEYAVRVLATNAVGDGPASDEVTATVVALTSQRQAATQNTPATGQPTISGTAQVGETLTAETSAIEDADGLDNVAYNYQWLAADTEIAGATSSNYTLVDADEGKTIRVKVSFTDDAENQESLTSEATETVGVSESHDRPYNLQATVAEGAITLTWQDPDTHRSHGSYHILRHRPELGEDKGLVYVEYTPSADRTFTDSAVEPGVLYVFAVKAVKDYFGFLGPASDLVEVRMPPGEGGEAPNSPATGVPTISGTAQVGETLTGNTSGIADEDGLDNASFAYQWMADDSDIAGATDSTYTLTPDYLGKSVKVRVTFTDDAGNEESLTSVATDEVEARPNSPATGQPTITGTAQVGETLTASTSGIEDADGLSNVAYNHQWLAADAEIAGATSSSYTLADADEGKTIRVKVSFTDDAENQESLTSEATEAVQPKANSPATGQPTISGTAQVGETLTVDTSGIADADGLTNVSFNHQWVSNDGTTDTDIEDAAGSTYTLDADDEGKTIKVRVSFTDDAGNEETLTSGATAEVAARPNTPATGAPTISGTAQVGETLTASTSGIADADGLSGATFTYQWLADEEIQDATDSTYIPDADNEGQTIKVRVSFTDDAGNEETLTSTATRRVAARPNTAVTGAPRNLKVTAGDGGELKVSWEGPASDSGSTITGYKVQWKSGAEEYDGTAASTRQATVTGMASLSYIITGLTNDVAHTVRVIAINSQGDGAPSAGVTGTPLSKNAQLHAWIEKDIVEKHEGDHPWLRTTWEYMNEPGFELVAMIHNKFAGRVFVRHFVSSEHGLEGTKAYRMEVEIRYLPHSKGLMPEQVAIHEMAHVYTLTNDLSATPAPLGIAHVYFERMEGIVSSCVSREIYASMTTIDVLGPISTSYWRKCRGTNDDGNIDSLTQEALSVVGSALSGRMPQWFADTYNDSEGNTDLETLWADVKATGDNYRPTVVYRLRNAFGGYCDNEKIARYAHDGYNGVERNPWRDGGCVPKTPGKLAATAGDGELVLSWEAPAYDGGSPIESYRVQWKSGSEGYDSSRQAVVTDLGSLSHTITGLTNGAAYMVRIVAYNHNGDGEVAEVTATPTPNRYATGAPTISGTAQVGETLTAGTSEVADSDGLDNAAFSYQWIRNDGNTDEDIQDATASTYTLVAEDQGKTVRVRVSFTDDGGNDETLTSAATAAGAEPTDRPHGLAVTASLDTIILTWKDADNDPGLDLYQILRHRPELGEPEPLVYVEYTQSSSPTFTDTEVEPGVLYVYRVKAVVDPFGYLGEASGAAEIRMADNNTLANGAPNITGTAQVGETLTADTSGIADSDGLDNATFRYQWVSNDGTTDTDIEDAARSTYTPVATDEGETIKVRVSFTDDGGNAETLTSEATAVVEAALTAELQGVPDSHNGSGTFTFRILFSEPVNVGYATLKEHSFQVSNATIKRAQQVDGRNDLRKFTIQPASDAGVVLVLPTTADCANQGAICTNDGKRLSTRLEIAVQGPAPANSEATGMPTVSGTAQVGETLTASASGVSDADGLDNATFSYQWIRNDGSTKADIQDATESTYTLAADDEGKTVKVRVSFTDDAGNEETLTSAATAAAAGAPSEPLTASLENTPENHDGETPSPSSCGSARSSS